jgi:hypothetical protein
VAPTLLLQCCNQPLVAGGWSYIYSWKTDKAWAGTCRSLSLKLIDGTTHLAYFTFTK